MEVLYVSFYIFWQFFFWFPQWGEFWWETKYKITPKLEWDRERNRDISKQRVANTHESISKTTDKKSECLFRDIQEKLRLWPLHHAKYSCFQHFSVSHSWRLGWGGGSVVLKSREAWCWRGCKQDNNFYNSQQPETALSVPVGFTTQFLFFFKRIIVLMSRVSADSGFKRS